MTKIVVGIVIGLLMGMAVPVLGQPGFAGMKCSEFSGLDETSRGWWILGAADAVFVTQGSGHLKLPELPDRYVGLPMSAFAGAVTSTCWSQPYERVGRVILRLMGYNL